MEDEKGRPMTYWGGKPEGESPSSSSRCSSSDCENVIIPASFCLVIGPIEANLDGFTAQDRKEWLEDAGWQNVRIEWL